MYPAILDSAWRSSAWLSLEWIVQAVNVLDSVGGEGVFRRRRCDSGCQ